MTWWYSAKIINAYEAYINGGFKAALYSHFLIMYCFWWLILALSVAFVTAVVTLEERKLIASIQSRRGPSKPGYLGILQPIADALKLIIKEYVKPRDSYDSMYVGAAFFSFLIALFFWNIPTLSYENPSVLNEWTIMLGFLISIAHVYTILFAGWASNSKYSFLGALRSCSQLVAYDIVIVLIYMNIFFYSREMSYESLSEFQSKMGSFIFLLPIQFLIFFVALLAETSRHPFDMPEAESELVAGYNVEYSSIRFAMFFLAEYSTIVFCATILDITFLGTFYSSGGLLFSICTWLLKMLFLMYLIIKARAILPRYRYDQLMEIGWKILIPIEVTVLFINILITSVF